MISVGYLEDHRFSQVNSGKNNMEALRYQFFVFSPRTPVINSLFFHSRTAAREMCSERSVDVKNPNIKWFIQVTLNLEIGEQIGKCK